MIETLDPQTLTPLVLTSGLGWLLVVLGLAYRRLEPRRTRARCAACGRLPERDGRCGCTR
jgi:hypothetical protein